MNITNDLQSPAPDAGDALWSPSVLPPVTYCTQANGYGIYHSYPLGIPSIPPDELYSLDAVSDLVIFATDSGANTPDGPPWWASFGSSLQNVHRNYFALFLSTSVFWLMNWFYNGSNNKSLTDLDNLVSNIILADDFKKEDLISFCAKCEVEHLDNIDTPHSHFSACNGWNETSVEISLPAEKVSTLLLWSPCIPCLYHQCSNIYFTIHIRGHACMWHNLGNVQDWIHGRSHYVSMLGAWYAPYMPCTWHVTPCHGYLPLHTFG